MLVKQYPLHGICGSKKVQRLARQSRQVFQDHGVMNRLNDGLAPRERTMTCYKDTRTGKGVSLRKGLDHGSAGVQLVVGFNFMGSEATRARDGAMEIISMGGTQRRQFAAGLCPSGSKETVCMHDSADLFKRPIQRQVGRGI